MRLPYIVVPALAAGLAAACAGGGTDDIKREPLKNMGRRLEERTANAPRDACALLPASEVTAVIGESVRDSLALRMTGAGDEVTLSQCNYATATNPAAASLMLRRSGEGETAAGGLQSIRETFTQSGVTPEDVPGLGDGALWGGNQLHVITARGWSIVVSPTRAGGLVQARALAERALARL